MGDDDICENWLGKLEECTNFIQTSNTRTDLKSKVKLIEYFGAINYAVFAAMLAVSAFIGIFFWWRSRGRNSTDEMLMAGKSMGTFPMTLSLIASFMSAITLLGTPAELYKNGTQYVILALSYPFVMAATVYIFLPVFDKVNITTSYEYLELRFNKYVRLLASACFTLQMVLYMAIVVYAPALALSQVGNFYCQAICKCNVKVSEKLTQTDTNATFHTTTRNPL